LVLYLRKVGTALQFTGDRHPSDDEVERYSMNRLAGPELAEFEEHLLICEACQKRLAEEDRFRQAMRDAGKALEQRAGRRLARLPKWAWAAGLVAALLLILLGVKWQSRRQANLPAATIFLQTTRGANTSETAPAGATLILVMDLTGLPQFPSYDWEIVDAAGHPLARAKASAQGNRLQETLARGLGAGAYFVRIYSPLGELLREYALNVRG